MKNKKGFTMVELMATIIIIGILLLIVVPNISNTIKRQNKRTFTLSVQGILRSADTYFADNALTVKAGDCIDVTSGILKLEKGSSVTSGEVCIINGQSYSKKITNGKYCASGINDNLNVEEGQCSD